MDRSRFRAARVDGFTLIELMLAATLSAMLVLALAQTFSGFGRQLEVLREQEVDRQMDAAAAELAHQVRRAWVVSEPSEDELLVVDAYGNPTRYWLDGSNLRVRRPSGAEGTLIEDVKGFAIHAVTTQRLRPATDVDDHATWWESTATPTTTLGVEDGLPIALGFTLPSEAPVAMQSISGIDERAVGASLDRMLLSLAFAPAVVEVDDGAQLAHGDVLGSCTAPPPPRPDAPPLPDPWSSTLSVELHEARAPDDGRPYGAALGSVEFPVSALPGGRWTWVPLSSLGPGHTAVCHYPPGQPSDMHTLGVPTAELPAHLAHGDVLGACLDGAASPSTEVLVFSVPAAEVPLDLAPLSRLVVPGRAYTLVLSVQGRGTALLGGSPARAAATSGVAAGNSGGSVFESKPFAIRRALDGVVTYTTTQAHDVISSLTLEIEMNDGRSRASTAAVLSQTGVANPWLGPIPGEYPALQEVGR